MANTPQAKKRIRRNANARPINHSRISRIRTFIKAVELAIASGKKAEAAEALKKVTAGDGARSRPRRYPQEHRRAEIFAPVQEGCVARLKAALKRRLVRAAGRPAARPVSGPSKKCSNSRDSRGR